MFFRYLDFFDGKSKDLKKKLNHIFIKRQWKIFSVSFHMQNNQQTVLCCNTFEDKYTQTKKKKTTNKKQNNNNNERLFAL